MATVIDTTGVTPPPAAPKPRRRPRAELIAAAALLTATAVLYIWGLGASGWANSFYSAAVQAGSMSWKAFFFGSSDPANSITVDKPPMSLWLMALSVRVFGLSSWSMLVPQALLGVASVALLWRTVRRTFGPAAGLLAGLLLALTPVATLMFRFNNPDALLVLLMIAAVWALTRAVETGKLRWMLAVGALCGFGFLTKQLQIMLIVPALAITYFVAGPVGIVKRVGHLFASLGAMVVAAGWWIAIVELWPASSRPWIGGSQNNSILELTFGYNGLGRLNGEETGSVVPGGGAGGASAYATGGGAMPGGAALPDGGGMAGAMPGGGTGGGMWGNAGIGRLFEAEQGGQIAWLIPAALIALAAGLLIHARSPRTDRSRAAYLVWGLWLLVTGLTFSFMAGIFHAYYTVALAPAVAALVGIGFVELWRRRSGIAARLGLILMVVATAAMSWILLSRVPDFLPWLRWVIVLAAVPAVVMLAIPAATRGRTAVVALLTAGIVGLAGPTAYALDTAATPHTGSIVSAGPSTGMGGPGGGRAGGGFPGGPGGMNGDGTNPAGMAPFGSQAGAGAGGSPAAPSDGGTADGGGRDGGGAGGLLQGSSPSEEMVATLSVDADSYTWVAATVGSNSASGYQLAVGRAVMPIGGFNGSDPSPTLAEFQGYVEQGLIHYFIAGGGGMGGAGGSGTASEITTWVQDNFTATTIDGVTLYDLT